jgi:monovalent cation/hydrogen antiporter
MYTVPYIIRLVDRRPQQRLRRLGARHRLPVAWSGFRGGVSLAAALAVPVAMDDGSRFPGRDLIIVVTFGVILVTLLVQGLTLPGVLRWSRLPDDDSELVEQRLAQRTITETALAALPAEGSRLGVSDEVVDRVRAELEERLAELADPTDNSDDPAAGGVNGRSDAEEYRLLRSALLTDKRAALVGLRDAKVIDDIVLRRVQARLDAEEVRLSESLEAETE